MRNVVVQREAIHETSDALAWYEAREPGLGLRFLHDLEVLYANIARRPEIFQSVGNGFQRALMRKFPYAIFFELDRETIIIHSVFHCSRNSKVWQTRLGRKNIT
jgi:plasmid stabilization system protein ParE